MWMPGSNFYFLHIFAFSAEGLEVTRNFFTSLNDNHQANVYFWESTGQSLGAYRNWYEKNPVQGVADCTVLAAGGTASPVSGKWQSVSCSYEFGYICESAMVQCISN